MHEDRNAGTRRLAVAAAAATLLLVLAGGFVTTTRTGDTIPAWPKSWGRMEAGWPVEWTHRALAAVVAALVAALAFRARRPLAWVALAAVVVQALLGGLRIYLPKAAVAITHAVFGQVVFCAMVATAFALSRRGAGPREGVPDAPGWGAAATATCFLQLVAGAVTRHTGAGLHVHLAGAVLVLLTVSVFASRLMLSPLARGAHLLLGLLGTQIALGIATWILTARGFVRSHESPVLQILTISAHVALGAALLAATLVLTLAARPAAGRLEPAWA
jgi:cytochrome c oxidase assembly protein subunit 15